MAMQQLGRKIGSRHLSAASGFCSRQFCSGMPSSHPKQGLGLRRRLKNLLDEYSDRTSFALAFGCLAVATFIDHDRPMWLSEGNHISFLRATIFPGKHDDSGTNGERS